MEHKQDFIESGLITPVPAPTDLGDRSIGAMCLFPRLASLPTHSKQAHHDGQRHKGPRGIYRDGSGIIRGRGHHGCERIADAADCCVRVTHAVIRNTVSHRLAVIAECDTAELEPCGWCYRTAHCGCSRTVLPELHIGRQGLWIGDHHGHSPYTASGIKSVLPIGHGLVCGRRVAHSAESAG